MNFFLTLVISLVPFNSSLYSQSNLYFNNYERLIEERDELLKINSALRLEYSSLLQFQSTNSRVYVLRLNSDLGENLLSSILLKRDIVNKKILYSLSGFSDPYQAYRLAASIRKLNPENFEVILRRDMENLRFIQTYSKTGLSRKSQTMEIEE